VDIKALREISENITQGESLELDNGTWGWNVTLRGDTVATFQLRFDAWFFIQSRTALKKALDEIEQLRKCLLEVRVLISGAYYQDDITEIKELIGEALQGGVRR